MRLDDRPPFMELYRSTSKYIEHIAGYLELGYNPFAGKKQRTGQPDEGEGC